MPSLHAALLTVAIIAASMVLGGLGMLGDIDDYSR